MHTDHWPPDAIAAVAHPDPYPYYAALATRRAPRYDERLRLWVAAHPATVRETLAHPDCRVRPVHEPVPAALAGPAGRLFGALARMNDGDRHAAAKAALRQALAALPAALAIEHAAAAAAHMAVRSADALNAFVFGVPVQTMASLLGFADDDLARVAELVACYVAGISPLASGEAVAAAHAAADSLLDMVGRLPPQGLAARVAQAPWPDRHALLANLVGLMTQTHEATAGLLGNCIVARLRGDASAPAALVAGVMERDPAIHNTRRFAAADIDIGGTCVPAGQALLLVLAGTAGFGHGRHACPGQALAQCIATQALGTLDAAGPLPAVGWRYRPSVNARLPEFFQENER